MSDAPKPQDTTTITRPEVEAMVKMHLDPLTTELAQLRAQVERLAPLGELATNMLALWKGKVGKTVRGLVKLMALGAGGGIGANAAGILDWLARFGSVV